MRGLRGEPPDGGYGWLVVTSAFFVTGLTTAVLKTFGLFFLDIQRSFNVLTSSVSWVTSITIAMFHLGAPVSSALCVRFTHRAVIMMGGCLTSLGMVLASLSVSLPWMYLTMGFLQGLGMALAWIPAQSMVTRYFSQWRPIAYALASSGECVSAMAFGPLFQWLIDIYSWQGALLVIGGLQLNLCVCAALMRPLENPWAHGPAALGSGGPDKPAQGSTFQWSLLRKPEMLLYVLFSIFTAAGFFVLPLLLVPFAVGLGLEEHQAASLMSLLALGDLVGRLSCGCLASMRPVRNLQLLMLPVTLLGVSQALLASAQSYGALLAFSAFCGLLFGCVVAVHVTAIVDIVGVEGFDSGLGLFMLFRSSGGFIGPPVAAWLVDFSGDFCAGFYLSGFCLIISAVFVVFVDRLVEKRKVQNGEQGLPSVAKDFSLTSAGPESRKRYGALRTVMMCENRISFQVQNEH